MVWRERCEWGGATTLLSYFDDDFADVGVGFHVLVRLHDVIEREPPSDCLFLHSYSAFDAGPDPRSFVFADSKAARGRYVGMSFSCKPYQQEDNEIIMVDGYSKDKTVDEARKFNVKIIYDGIGKGSALRKGFHESSNDIIIMMDADNAHNRSEVIDVIKKINEGYDVCMPSRFMGAGGSDDITKFRIFGNNFYKFLVKLFWGVSYSDICYGFRGFSREALDTLRLEANGFDIELEIAIKTAKKKLKYIEIPSKEGKREYGEGKLNFWTSLTLDKRILLELYINQ